MLKRNISALGLLFSSISGVIGSAWLFAPYYTAKIAGPLSIYTWLIAGVAILLIAVCFAELAAMFPVPGGLTFFAKLSYGAPISFLASWVNWLSFVIVPPIEVQATLQYSSHFFPQLIVRSYAGVDSLSHLGLAVAIGLLLLFMVINFLGIKLVTLMNNTIVWWKLIIPVLVIIMLCCVRFEPANFSGITDYSLAGLKKILLGVSTGGAIFALLGFRTAIELAGEAENPQRSIPFALIGSIVICLLIYVALEVAFIGALNPLDLAQGWGQLVFKGDAAPLIGLASAVGLGWLVIVLYLDAIASPSGTALIVSASTARIVFAMSKRHLIPSFFLKLNRHGIPFYSVILNFIIAVLFFLPFKGWQAMVSFLVSLSVFSYGLGPVCLYALRKQCPNQKRLFRLPIAPLFTLLAFYCCNLIVYWSGWENIERLLIAVGLGIVLIALREAYEWRQPMKRYRIKAEFAACLWLIPYLIGMGLIAYLGTFGHGHGVIGFGWDFCWLGALSIAIFGLAHRSRLDKKWSLQTLAEW